MSRWPGIAGGLVAALVLHACTPAFTLFQSGTRLGAVRLYAPRDGKAVVVFLFSDLTGWDHSTAAAAQRLSDSGAVVIGVDLHPYLDRLAASDDGCHYLLSEIEDLSQRIQLTLSFDGYRAPILAGVGEGGALVYAALAQTPAATVEGAVSISPTAALKTRVPLCPGAASTPDPAGGFRYAVVDPLPGWFRQSSDGAHQPLATRLLTQLQDAIAAAPPRGKQGSEVPVVEYPAKGATTALIFFSGDGGWRDLDKQIGEIVVRQGVAVVGVDCLRYFWRAKMPEQIATDLAALMRAYQGRWGISRFALAGYSFGADIIPFAYNRLPADLQTAVMQVSLLGVESTALFEFKLEGWWRDVPGQPVLPELLRVPPRIVQCFYGEEEEDTLCPKPEMAGTEVIRTKGSHHFDGNYPALAERLMSGLARRSESASNHAP